MSMVVRPGGDPLKSILSREIKFFVEENPLEVWDHGVFFNELHRLGFVPATSSDGNVTGDLEMTKPLKQGTYQGTMVAITELFRLCEKRAVSDFDSKGFEPIIPLRRELALKQTIYNWSNPNKDGYPPHLADIPKDEGVPQTEIFDREKLDYVKAIAQAIPGVIPDVVIHTGTPYAGPTLADCETYNREAYEKKYTKDGKEVADPTTGKYLMGGMNLGHLPDWYSDARFAQQHLSGVNPCTIEAAPSEKVKSYAAEAGRQKLQDMQKLLSDAKDLFIQDYSYFREATGVTNEQDFVNKLFSGGSRYACAPVVIFQLCPDGNLHPLAITLDYRGSLERSVTIFNRRSKPDAEADVAEKDDWPWRYAKTCAQTADWARHEIASHLVDTHLVEEAIIVATNRTIPDGHLLYELMSPHWFRTLPLNKAAREVLVPAVIARIAGFGPTYDPRKPLELMQGRAFKLVDWSYKNFHFQDKYVPNDLKKRGFNLDSSNFNDPKFRNYPYAKDMLMLWVVIKDFVRSVIGTKYKKDDDVRRDTVIADWCTEIQTNGQLATFPTITTVEELIDAVTMCIHTASPQHTAVNYLQQYYYSFVPAKPAALCTPLPTSLQELQSYTEAELTKALPIGTDTTKWQDWMLAAQLPELLSFTVDTQYNLITYATSLYNVNKNRTIAENKELDCQAIKKAAELFYSRLMTLGRIFDEHSKGQTAGTVEYKVLQPEVTAISILI